MTGSSMGIGKELVRQILINGGKVVITARDKERLKMVAEEFEIYRDNILIQDGDITHFETNEMIVKKTIERFGKLDVLITNAGFSCYGNVEIINPGVVKKVVDVNIYGSLFPVMASILELKKSRGSILFISSLAGLYGLPGYSTYSLSKMALKALAQSLRIELKSSGIFVGIAYPGFTENESEKRTLNPSGELEEVPPRPKNLTLSRQETAQKLLRQIEKKKHTETHSVLGNITAILSKYFPGILKVVLSKNYTKKTG
ncbi:MAG: SDR family NAD(P)-dependent oxidoreductase [Bacteroidia bacterium]